MKTDSKKRKDKKMRWMKPELEYLGGTKSSGVIPPMCESGTSNAFGCGTGAAYT